MSHGDSLLQVVKGGKCWQQPWYWLQRQGPKKSVIGFEISWIVHKNQPKWILGLQIISTCPRHFAVCPTHLNMHARRAIQDQFALVWIAFVFHKLVSGCVADVMIQHLFENKKPIMVSLVVYYILQLQSHQLLFTLVVEDIGVRNLENTFKG